MVPYDRKSESPRERAAQLVPQLKTLFSPYQDMEMSDVPSNPGFLWRLVHLNPVLWRALIISGLALAATVGFIVSDNTQNAVLTFIGALIAVIQALWTKGSVVPNQKVLAYKPDPINAPSQVLPGEAVSTDVVSVANAAASPGPLPFPVSSDSRS